MNNLLVSLGTFMAFLLLIWGLGKFMARGREDKVENIYDDDDEPEEEDDDEEDVYPINKLPLMVKA